MKTSFTCYQMLLVIFLGVPLFGCAPIPTLIYQQKDFSPQNVELVTVTPVLDARRQVFADVNFEEETEELQDLVIEYMQDKGYSTKVVKDSTLMGNIHPTEIPFISGDHIREIGPSDANWLLVPTVTDLKPFSGATTEYAEVTFYLFEKRTGKLWWEGSGMLLSDDLDDVVEGLMDEFPSKR